MKIEHTFLFPALFLFLRMRSDLRHVQFLNGLNMLVKALIKCLLQELTCQFWICFALRFFF